MNYFSAVLSDHDYELDLTSFEIYYTILNVNSSNNKFYFDKDDKEIVIPEGLYELWYKQVSETRNLKQYHEKKDAL